MDYRKNDKNGTDRTRNEGLNDISQIRNALNESFDLSKITVSESLIQMTLQKANMQSQKNNSQNGSVSHRNPEQQMEYADTRKKKMNFHQIGLAAACVGVLFVGAFALKDLDLGFSKKDSKESSKEEYASETTESRTFDDAVATQESNAATEESKVAADQATEKSDASQDYSLAAGESMENIKNDIFRFQTEDMVITILPEEIVSISILNREETLIQGIMKEDGIKDFYEQLGSMEGSTVEVNNTAAYERHYMITAKEEQTWKEIQIWSSLDTVRYQITTASGEIIEGSFTPTNASDLADFMNQY